MKPYFIALIAVMAANQAFSQQDQTSDALFINTSINSTESNVDRTVSSGYAVKVNSPGASYTGTDVNFVVLGGGISNYGIELDAGKSINLKTSGEDVWNTITVSGRDTYGINIDNASEISHISNTIINCAGEGAEGIESSFSEVELDNVQIHISHSSGGYGIAAHHSRVTNEGKGQVTITSEFTGDGSNMVIGSAIYCDKSIVDLHDATISFARTGSMGGVPFGVLTAAASKLEDSSISLKNSSIASTSGNILATLLGEDGRIATMNLDNVNLDDAKGQVIVHAGEARLNLSNGTNLDGYVEEFVADLGSFEVSIISGSSWHVTQSSTLGAMGSLTLDGTSAIMFDQVSPGLFTDITSALITLDSGAELMLGIDAASLQALLDANGGEYDVKLFTTDQAFSNDGVVLVTSDGQVFQYTTDNLGTYTLLGVVIPEPTTSTLWLAAVALLALRRRK